MFVLLMILDAGGTLDLESPEELLTSSSTPGPVVPSGPELLGASFLHHFSWRFFFLLWRILTCILESFSMFFAFVFRALILHGFVIICLRICMYLLTYFCWFPWSYIQLAKPSKTCGLHFRKHMFFIKFLDMCRCSLLHPFVLYCAQILGSIWYGFGIKTIFFSVSIF